MKKPIQILAFLLLPLVAAAQEKKLKVFILPGQSNMEAHLKKYEAELITPEEEVVWKRGASNAGYHYLGCAKTFAFIGQHLAEANLSLLKADER